MKTADLLTWFWLGVIGLCLISTLSALRFGDVLKFKNADDALNNLAPIALAIVLLKRSGF